MFLVVIYCLLAAWLLLFQPHLIDFIPVQPAWLKQTIFLGIAVAGGFLLSGSALDPHKQ